MEKKWQYRILNLTEFKNDESKQQILDDLGQQGWELVAVIPQTGWQGKGIASQQEAYFKRPVEK